MSTSLELMVHQLDRHGRAERLGRLEPDELRRRGVTAARDRDEEALWALIEAYLVLRGARGGRVSPYTLRNYRAGLRMLLAWVETSGMSLLHPKPNEGAAYVRSMENGKLKPASVKVRLAAARALFAALRWTGATDAAPFTDIRAAADRVPKHQKRKPYPESDLQALLEKAGPQEQVIVLLGAHAGLRVSEMTSLQRSDVHLDDRNGPWLTVTGKGDKRQDVPLSRSTAAALERWIRMTPQLKGRVLSFTNSSSVERTLQAVCIAAGVTYSRRQVHGLRHSAGTRVYQETSDLLAVRDHLRHRDITSSEVYVDYARADKPSITKDW
ncbi:site-specific integrase (plasmid) [Deinococcus sp. KNUC1210]|uniref:site-specific integrase n=1 Tax=Deinococcus sp. KNUC1210 TaxID=2917691 RepID=UPI001EF05FB8|nr:site-specific integrase [Deinococcus sp. KNUC1210]ULH17405.1 site-specific integrase [Deinococcus sp. KNUC1210]